MLFHLPDCDGNGRRRITIGCIAPIRIADRSRLDVRQQLQGVDPAIEERPWFSRAPPGER